MIYFEFSNVNGKKKTLRIPIELKILKKNLRIYFNRENSLISFFIPFRISLHSRTLSKI